MWKALIFIHHTSLPTTSFRCSRNLLLMLNLAGLLNLKNEWSFLNHRFYLFLFATASSNNIRLRKDNANHSFGVMNIVIPPLMQSLTQLKMCKPLAT